MHEKNTAEEAARTLVEGHLLALGVSGGKGPADAVERGQWVAGVYTSTFDVVRKIHEGRGEVRDLDAERAARLAGDWLGETSLGPEFFDARTVAPWLGSLYDAVLAAVVTAHAKWGETDPGQFGVIRLTTDFIRKHAAAIKNRSADATAAGTWIGNFYATVCEGMRTAVSEAGATHDSAWTAFSLASFVSPAAKESGELDARTQAVWIADLYRTILAAVHPARE